jgi:hypothetical protein
MMQQIKQQKQVIIPKVKQRNIESCNQKSNDSKKTKRAILFSFSQYTPE